jgi:hypothetical protein
MALLTSTVLGLPQGTIGTLVFRVSNRTSIIAMRPPKRTKLPTAGQLAIMDKFGLVGKVAARILASGPLKDVWPIVSGKRQFAEVFQANYKSVSPDNPGMIAVSPNFGFSLTNAAVTAGANSIQFTADALGVHVGIDTAAEKQMVACGIVILSGPTQENYPDHEVISFQTDQTALDLISPIELTAELNGGELTKYTSYATRTAYACLVSLNDANKGIRYSTNVKSA